MNIDILQEGDMIPLRKTVVGRCLQPFTLGGIARIETEQAMEDLRGGAVKTILKAVEGAGRI